MRRREWDEASAAKAPALSSPITSLLLAAEHTFTYERCYLEKQPYLDAFRRAHLLDWLVHVGDRLRVHEETSFLAVVYFDRFVERVEIALHDRRLAVLAALLLACKVNEVDVVPEIDSMLDYHYTHDEREIEPQELREMEAHVLRVLQYRMCAPTASSFLAMYFAAGSEAEVLLLHGGGKDDAGAKQMHDMLLATSRMLLHLSLLDSQCCAFLPSMLAAAAILVARMVQSCKPSWTPAMEARTKLCEHTLRAVGRRMAQLMFAADGHVPPDVAAKHTMVFRKYQQARFFRVAKITPEVWCVVAHELSWVKEEAA